MTAAAPGAAPVRAGEFPLVTPEIRPLLTAAFAWDLPHCALAPPPTPLDDERWARLFDAVHRQRGDGVLAWAIHDGWWPATDRQRTSVYGAHRRNMALAVLLERELVEIASACAASHTSFRVLKGVAIAHLDERDPSLRSFGDVDLLVAADDLETVATVLEARGGRRRYSEPHRGFDRRFSKGMSFAFDRNCEIDVHRSLASGAFGLSIVLDDLFRAAEPFTVGGVPLLALDRPNRFLHAAYHALLGSPQVRLGSLRDLVLTAPRDDHETREVLGRARRWKGEAVVAQAVALAAQWFAWTPPLLLGAWAGAFTPSARDRRWLAAYVGTDRSYAGQMLVGLEAVPGVRGRVAYAIGNARSPSHAPTLDRWQRGVRALRHSVRP